LSVGAFKILGTSLASRQARLDLDEQAVSILVDELERLVRDGKFRLRPPDQTG
jgi:hypothetical protein